ncbi:unnamed protein product [Rotaria sordida]|uniref:Cap-specific mRNA (nucleoside-2'-O-)-methyltransferase 1 n=1 Tax=Rotaria sordida TaxID=392033 RepID=A0A818J815_9BILA|nr:unnamed protein product [Rotaria sordida]
MSMSKKRKANEDNEQSSSKTHSKKNRLSVDNNQSTTGSFDSAINQTHYAPYASLNKPSSSSDISHMWSLPDSFNSSFSSTSSNSDYDSISSSYKSNLRTNSNLTTTTDDISMIYNPNHQIGKQEIRDTKRELSSQLNGTPPPKKKPRNDGISTLPTPPPSSDFSFAATKMMEKMGYDKNRGLGLNAQGPTKLVEESKQKGRRGLGFTYRAFNDETADWNFDNDPAPVEEEIHWCPSSDHIEAPLDLDDMRDWIKLGPKKKVIDDEVEFCDEDILKEMLDGKTVFDELPQKEMEEARARSNVYETIGQSIFLNRAAVKMANIDCVFERMFTDPKTPNDQRSLVQSDEPFYFADICAGPGGFSEYILWKKQWRAKGFGFTLKGNSDFALHKFLAGAPETFDPYYGVKDIDGDGDIFKSENIDALQNYVNKCTKLNGVHIVMADGGFSVEGQENIQEILSKQLYLCQFLTALSILRPGGHFVCKLFDLFTPFSVGLIYLMYRTFNQISIHKPVTSRPANSERYIICKSLRGDVRDVVRTYMYEINALQNKYRDDTEYNDVQSIVPMNILKGNEKFYEYIRNSNNQLGDSQIRNLKKIRAFVSNASLKDYRQSDIRTRCLKFWMIPDKARQKPQRLMCNDIQNALFHQLGNGMENILCNTPNLFKNSVLDQHQIQSLFDYRCTLSLGEPVLLLSCGRGSVFAMELKNKDKRWSSSERTQSKIELPPYTLLLAERVKEQFTDGRNNRQRSAIYIIDAYFIGNENMLVQNKRPIVFMDRYRSLKLFEKTINKPARTDLAPIRIHEQLRLEQMDVQFDKLCTSGSLNQIDSERLWFTNNDIESKPRVEVRGLWIFKFVQHPWTILLSKSHQTKYFHNQINRTSIPAAPNDSSHVASLRSMLENSFYWDFNNRDDSVQKSVFISFIQEKNHEIQSQQRISHHRTATSGNN